MRPVLIGLRLRSNCGEPAGFRGIPSRVVAPWSRPPGSGRPGPESEPPPWSRRDLGAVGINRSARFPGPAIQRANQQLPNAVYYGNLRLTYTDEELALAAQQTGNVGNYSGHLSSNPGDSESGTTIRVQQELATQARANREKEKANKKKGPVREEAKKTPTWKAFNKGKLLMQDALSVKVEKYDGQAINDASKVYSEYLKKAKTANEITEETVEKCEEYWDAMAEARTILDEDDYNK